MTITLPNNAQTAGIPSQWSDSIAATNAGLLTGDHPSVVTQDVIFAPSQTIASLTPVGPGSDGLWVPATDDVAPDAHASQLGTFSGVGTADDTITIGAVTYTLKAAPTTVANQVKIGATAADTANNLIAAINRDEAGSGTLYGSATVEHPAVYARLSASAVVEVVAKSGGTAGNAVATTDSGTGFSWAAATLAGGKQGVGVKAAGITIVDLVTPASPATGGKIYRAGCFNPDLLNFGASFDTDAKKFAAFEGAPSPTNIIIRRPRAYTL